jgi:sugar diacid utilization regulator
MIHNSLLLLPSQKIIDALSPIVAPSTLNIFNTEGIILASSDKERIGSFHSGALKASTTKKEVKIYPHEVENYQGAKMGVNTPIIRAGEVIGVVGIYGHPDEVKTISTLLAIISDHFIEQSKAIESSQRRIAIKEDIINIISSGDTPRVKQILDQINKLNINLKTPISLVLIACKDDTDFFDVNSNFTKSKLIKSSTDLLLKLNNDYLILKSNVDDLDGFLDNILAAESHLGLDILNISAGTNFNKIENIFSSFNIAQSFKYSVWNHRKYNAMNPDELLLILFDKNLNNINLCELYVSQLKEKLDDMSSIWVYPTIEAYLFEDGRIQGMSEKLNIHKNSCIYRINKIINTLNLENCNTFTIAYFLGMIIQIQKSKDF